MQRLDGASGAERVANALHADAAAGAAPGWSRAAAGTKARVPVERCALAGA